MAKLDTRPSSGGLYFHPEWRTTLFVLVMVPLMAGLGFWQLQRAEEKTVMAATFEQKQAEPPAPLASVWDRSASELAYLPVEISGRFLPDEYFLLDNRMFKGRYGYEVVGVVALQGSDQLVLVNRGWIAADPARQVQPVVPPAVGPVTITGQVYVAPGAPYLLAEQRLSADWPKLVQALEMDILVPPVEAINGGRVFPYPVRINAGEPAALGVDWQVINISPDKHRGYAVQWFCMSAVLLIFYILRSSNIWQLLRPSRRTGA